MIFEKFLFVRARAGFHVTVAIDLQPELILAE